MKRIDIEIPEGIDVKKERDTLTVASARGQISRVFKVPSLCLSVSDDFITVSTDSKRKKDLAILGTVRSRIANMLRGVEKGYEYKLKVYYAHFPMNVSVDGNVVVIDNFLGEKYPRYAAIVGDTKVDVESGLITVSGIDKESVGQTAANMEQATRIRKKDPRIFQDGIYLYEKDGVRVK